MWYGTVNIESQTPPLGTILICMLVILNICTLQCGRTFLDTLFFIDLLGDFAKTMITVDTL